MTVIELSDADAAALKARAAAQGLSLQAWLKQLAAPGQQSEPVEAPLQTAADIVLGHMRNVPLEIMATMPQDGASQHDHYIYGWPKRDV
jgi:plasmid stability protein